MRVILFMGIFFIIVLNHPVHAGDPSRFPLNSITMIIQWKAGGTYDLSGRKLADLAGKILGQPMIVENKSGGGGVIGTAAIARAKPDGYTVGTASFGPLVFSPHLRSVPYRTKEDFTYIMQYGEATPIFCVRTSSPWKSFKEFIEGAQSKPGKMSYSSPGPLSGQHLFMEQVFLAEKVEINHVPVAGGIEATLQLLGGHIDGAITADMAPHLQAGKLRGLAIQTERRFKPFPDIPTFFELGYKIDPILWAGLIAPKGLDPSVLEILFDAFKKAYEDRSFKEFCTAMHLVPIFKNSELFKEKVFKDFDNQARILKQLGFIR